MTAQPARPLHPISASRQPLRIRHVAMVVAALAMAVLWPTAAHAKGPRPLPPEPQGRFVVGHETVVEVRLKWPAGMTLGGDAKWLAERLDTWPENWNVLAVDDQSEAADPLDNAEVLALTPLGEGNYATTFTPPRSGDWRLVIAAMHGVTGDWSLLEERSVHVANALPPSSTVENDASSLWPPVELLGAAGLAALLAATLRFRSRSHRGAKLGTAAATLAEREAQPRH